MSPGFQRVFCVLLAGCTMGATVAARAGEPAAAPCLTVRPLSLSEFEELSSRECSDKLGELRVGTKGDTDGNRASMIVVGVLAVVFLVVVGMQSQGGQEDTGTLLSNLEKQADKAREEREAGNPSPPPVEE